MGIGELQPFVCQAINVGRLDALCPIAADVCVANIIGVNEHDIGSVLGNRDGGEAKEDVRGTHLLQL